MQPRTRGFSLVELLVVVAILVVIAAIAIPNYLSAMQRAHEAAAIGYLRHIRVAQETYRMAHGEYAETFAKLGPYLTADLVLPEPRQWASSNVVFAFTVAAPQQGGGPPGQGGTPPGQGGTPPGQGGTPPGQGGTPSGGGGAPAADTIVHSMYIFRLTRPQPLQWECTAEPVRDRTINKFFYTDNAGLIRYSIGSLASASSPQL